MALTREQQRYRQDPDGQRERKRQAYRAKKGGQVRPYNRTAPVVGKAARPGRTHGLRSTYNAGCKCKWCCLADAAYRGARYHTPTEE